MKTERKVLFVLVSLLLALALNVGVASATTTVVSDKSTFIWGNATYQTYNFGGNAVLVVNENGGAGPSYDLLQWGLSGITLAPGQTIANATIRLACYAGTVGSGFSKGPYGNTISQITSSWIEGTAWQDYPYAQGPATDGSVTWSNKPTMTVLGGAAVDTITSEDVYDWHNIANGNELNALVEGWIRGTVSNYGVQLKHQEWSGGADEYIHSDEFSDVNGRPQLVFDVVPEPATMLLLTLGSALAIRRRKSA